MSNLNRWFCSSIVGVRKKLARKRSAITCPINLLLGDMCASHIENVYFRLKIR